MATETKRKIESIDRLCFRVEALQNTVKNERVSELLGVAKKHLMAARDAAADE